MKKLLLAVSILAITAAIVMAADVCSQMKSDYVRNIRPVIVTARYPPPGTPACVPTAMSNYSVPQVQDTQARANYISCHLCHDYMWRHQA